MRLHANPIGTTPKPSLNCPLKRPLSRCATRPVILSEVEGPAVASQGDTQVTKGIGAPCSGHNRRKILAMIGFRKIWHKIMGLERTPEHCEAHPRHQPSCKKCQQAEEMVAATWGQHWNAAEDTFFLQVPMNSHDTSPPHTSSGFDGFDGGSSGGGGVSGDF